MNVLFRLMRGIPRSSHYVDSAFGQIIAQTAAPSSLIVTNFINLAAHYSAYKKPPPEDEADDAQDIRQESRKGHLPRVKGPSLLSRVYTGGSIDDPTTIERRSKIQQLVESMSTTQEATNASSFIESFFQDSSLQSPSAAADAAAMMMIRNDGLNSDTIELGSVTPLSSEEENEILEELRGLRRGSQRIVLQRLLQGGMLRADPSAMAEWQKIQKAFRPPEGFRMKVVDVNRTCKGTRSGGLYRFSAMVVVGNGEGILGWGQGKAAEVNDAVRKAYHRACNNLYPIPRYNGHTIPEPAEAKFGKVKVVMYPKSSGRGIVASTLISEICKLAGIHDIGVKVHGSRNPRNTVKCLFEAFDKMKTYEEIVGWSARLESAGPALRPQERRLQAKRFAVAKSKTKKKDIKDQPAVTFSVPPGRFGRVQMAL